METNVYCPTCGAKICETEGSKNLKVRCRKCKSDIIIDKDDEALKVRIPVRETEVSSKTG